MTRGHVGQIIRNSHSRLQCGRDQHGPTFFQIDVVCRIERNIAGRGENVRSAQHQIGTNSTPKRIVIVRAQIELELASACIAEATPS